MSQETFESGRIRYKTCILAIIAAGLFGLGIVLFFLAAASFAKESQVIEYLGNTIVVVSIASALVALAALIRISIKPNLTGNGLAAAVLIPVCVIMVTLGGVPRIQRLAYQAVCRSNLAGIGKVLECYAYDNGGKLPTSSIWCDLLIAKADVSLSMLTCFSADIKRGESSYAMNKAVADKNLKELPPDTVVLFETDFGQTGERDIELKDRWFANQPDMLQYYKDDHDKLYKPRWNQVGGPEILSLGNHKNGCHVLFADSSVDFVLTDRIPKLRWTITPNTNLKFTPEVLAAVGKEPVKKRLFVWTSGIIAFASAIIICVMFPSRRNRYLIFAISLIAAVIGSVLGIWAEAIYYTTMPIQRIGLIAGFMCGLIFAYFYGAMVITAAQRIAKIKSFAIATGMTTGALCSITVHLILMLWYKEMTPNGVIAGLPFGIAAGAVLGYITGLILNKSQKIDTLATENSNVS